MKNFPTLRRITLGLFIMQPALAAATGSGWQPAFERLSINDGLSQSAVTAIHQDELGFLWFGTQEGLNRFNGSSFRVYRHDPADPDSLSSSSIEAITADDDGRLWLGTDDGGLNVFDPRTGRSTVLRHDPGNAASLSHDRVHDIALGPEGTAWLATAGGLDRVHPGDWRVERDPVPAPGLTGAVVTSVLLDEGGTVWVGTRRHGLYALSEGEARHYGPSQPPARRLAGNRVTDLASDGDGAIWVTTADGGLNRVDTRGVRALAGDLPDARLTAVHVRADGGLLAGSESGYLYRISPELGLEGSHVHRDGDPDSLAAGAVQDIFVDRTGVLWVGSYTGGVSKSKSLSGSVTHGVVSAHDGGRLPERSVRAFWVDGDGAVWVGTDGGLALAEPGADDYRVFGNRPEDPRSLSDDRVYAILRRANGELWVGTQGGLNRLDADRSGFERYRAGGGRGLPDDRVRDLVEDRRGRLWVATEGGLARYDDGADRFQAFTADAPGSGGLSGNEVTSLFADHEGIIWAGTNTAGLNRLDPDSGRFRHYGAGPGGLSHHSVWDVVRRGDTVWVGTFSGGLNRIDLETGAVRHYLERDGLANNVVYQIVPDERGRLWLSTNAGLSLFDPVRERFLNFNPRDGLQNYEYNSNASFRDGRGRIYFGGIDGMDVIDAGEITPDLTPAQAVLTDIQLFNRPVDPADDDRIRLEENIEYAQRLVLGYRAKVFSLGLAALHFANPDTNRLRYRLEGLHDDWLESDATQHYVTFNSPPAGDYRLRVQAAARGGAWGPERQLGIRIEPPPWLSPPAYAAYAAAVLLLLVVVVRAHFRRVSAERRQVARLNEMVADRTIELEALNEQLKDTNERLEEATRRDPLTHLANRRELMEWLPREQAAALRTYTDWNHKGSDRPEPEHARLCFLAVDIDDFKRLNDTWGHLAGDQVLFEFAQRLQDHCRSADLAVRWGGEEFLLVMRSVGPEGARYLAERIRRAVESRPVTLDRGDEVRLTCSIGFACYPFSVRHPQVGDWEAIVGLADAALYAAKKAGKNAWIGIGCPPDASAEEADALLHDPAVREASSTRATIWSSARDKGS